MAHHEHGPCLCFAISLPAICGSFLLSPLSPAEPSSGRSRRCTRFTAWVAGSIRVSSTPCSLSYLRCQPFTFCFTGAPAVALTHSPIAGTPRQSCRRVRFGFRCQSSIARRFIGPRFIEISHKNVHLLITTLGDLTCHLGQRIDKSIAIGG